MSDFGVIYGEGAAGLLFPPTPAGDDNGHPILQEYSSNDDDFLELVGLEPTPEPPSEPESSSSFANVSFTCFLPCSLVPTRLGV